MANLLILSLAAAQPLPAQLAEIAQKVASDGMPNCKSYRPDGSEGPCIPIFILRNGRSVNGYSEIGKITLTTTSAERLTQDEFALLVGHELAHLYLGHRRSTVDNELAADQMGAQLACKAGFSPESGVTLFRYVGQGRDHPQRAARIQSVLQVKCKIDLAKI